MSEEPSKFDHLVVLMLENRSFDHMLGFLYNQQNNVSSAGQAFEGLTGREFNYDSKGNKHTVFKIDSTAAFGISGVLAIPLTKKRDYLRYIMVEKKGQKKKPRAPSEANPRGLSQIEIYEAVANTKNNRVTLGSILEVAKDSRHPVDQAVGGALHRWLAESLTGLNHFVNYLHTKYMIIDSLTDDPTVISGSANFSSASTVNNDENMVVVQGNTDLADIFFGEFQRLFDHFYFRQIANEHYKARCGESCESNPYLDPTDSWTAEFFRKGSVKCLERELMIGKR